MENSKTSSTNVIPTIYDSAADDFESIIRYVKKQSSKEQPHLIKIILDIKGHNDYHEEEGPAPLLPNYEEFEETTRVFYIHSEVLK